MGAFYSRKVSTRVSLSRFSGRAQVAETQRQYAEVLAQPAEEAVRVVESFHEAGCSVIRQEQFRILVVGVLRMDLGAGFRARLRWSVFLESLRRHVDEDVGTYRIVPESDT